MLDHVDTCVVGGGVIGLAIARSLSRRSPELLVLEQAPGIGQGVSSRNSEVIHGGLYYAKDSLKSILCQKGKALLYDYCAERHIGFKRCGKLIVANNADEEIVLENIRCQAIANGLDDVNYWSAEQVSKAEPEVRAKSALHSPSTGIVNSHELMAALASDIEAQNAQIITRIRVDSISKQGENFLLSCDSDGQLYQFTSRILVNAAGLGAQALAGQCDFLDAANVPTLYLCKGSYFSYAATNPFQRLIYPVPDKSGSGLGIHATIDLGGQVKFGPDVEYIDKEDYSLSSKSRQRYYAAVKRYFPALELQHLHAAYVGIRPKLQGPGDSEKDFVIESSLQHGVPGLVNLFGMESPGLTSCLAIGDYIGEQLHDAY